MLRWYTTILSVLFPPSEAAHLAREATLQKLESLVSQRITRDAIVLLPYRDRTVRACVRQLKYYDDKRIASLFGAVLKKAVLDSLATPYILIPIPLSHTRMTERGYNQVARIGAAACKGSNTMLMKEDILTRAHTVSQTTLSREGRRRNVEGIFVIKDPATVANKDVVLLDDVMTTGATIREAKRVLLSAGARTVTCVAIAH